MIIAIFDTETTGLPKTKILNIENLDLWPHIVQFSYILFDTTNNEVVKIVDSIIKLESGVIISEESSNIHGITNEISLKKGINIGKVIKDFFQNIIHVDLVVAHNMSFDLCMVKAELLRLVISDKNIENKEKQIFSDYFVKLEKQKNLYCTMQESIDLCNIEAKFRNGDTYIKFPKLSELYEKLFGEIPNNLHNSLNDVIVTLRCFMKLRFDIDIANKEYNRDLTFQNLMMKLQ